MNKRGDTNWVLIMLILGVIVLVILAAGFMLGWNRLLPFLSTDNIETVVTQCQVSCTTNSQYGYCSRAYTVNDGEKDIATNVTCYQLSSDVQYNAINVADCPQIECLAA